MNYNNCETGITPIPNCPRFGVLQDGRLFQIAEIVTKSGQYITHDVSFSTTHRAVRRLAEQCERQAISSTTEEQQAIRAYLATLTP